jgi:heme o synthase
MLKAYIQLFRLKPIPMIMLMVVFAHMFALNETGLSFEWFPLTILVFTTGLANAATFALNQYYERHGDAKMARTQDRPIPAGKIAPRTALIAGLGAFVLGLALQYFLINAATAMATFLCGGLYVWSYTPLKSRSSISTLIGSLPGALLPFIGWYSVTQGLDLMIMWMSLMIFLWQIPHAFVICFRYKDQYLAAGGKQLPFVAGEAVSFRQSVWYTLINIPLIFVPFMFGVSGGIYLSIATLLTMGAIVMVTRFYNQRELHSAKQFFRYMLIYLPVLFVSMAANRLDF